MSMTHEPHNMCLHADEQLRGAEPGSDRQNSSFSGTVARAKLRQRARSTGSPDPSIVGWPRLRPLLTSRLSGPRCPKLHPPPIVPAPSSPRALSASPRSSVMPVVAALSVELVASGVSGFVSGS